MTLNIELNEKKNILNRKHTNIYFAINKEKLID